MKALEATIAEVIAGDVKKISILRASAHSDLLAAATVLPQLTISRAALISVLETWRSGGCSADEVQQWASFARRGYMPEQSGGVCPIEIEYDACDEELIVEIIGRLDEIGDEIDGDIDSVERESMLKTLGEDSVRGKNS